jgi:hypothetical protein
LGAGAGSSPIAAGLLHAAGVSGGDGGGFGEHGDDGADEVQIPRHLVRVAAAEVQRQAAELGAARR